MARQQLQPRSSDRLGPDWSWAGPAGIKTQLPFEQGFAQRQVSAPPIPLYAQPAVTATKTTLAGQAIYALSVILPTNPDWFSLVVTEARDDLQFELGGCSAARHDKPLGIPKGPKGASN